MEYTAQTNFDEDDLDMSFYGENEVDDEATQQADDEDNQDDESSVAAAVDDVEQTNDEQQADDQEDNSPAKQDATPTEEQPAKAPQDEATNREYARKRREAEEQARIAQAKDQARIDAVIEATGGENPYTHKPIASASDVDQFLLMKKIEKEGGDPIVDFPEYSKKQDEAKQAAAQAEAKRDEERQSDIAEFQKKYPDVDLSKLANDTQFDLFCGDRIGKTPLAQLYDSYIAFCDGILARDKAEKKKAQITTAAKKGAAVGSLQNPDGASDELYTREQLQSMSVEEIEKNYEKVEKSMRALK